MDAAAAERFQVDHPGIDRFLADDPRRVVRATNQQLLEALACRRRCACSAASAG